MENYLQFAETTVDADNTAEVSAKYNDGYLFTRKAKGNMYQTRSLRLKLAGFEFNSENRRVLRKFPVIEVRELSLPIVREDYDWKIHKMGKHFYEKKFGKGIFSAAKIKTLLTDKEKSNFNLLLRYSLPDGIAGYAIAYLSSDVFHYAYPFYEFEKYPSNFGMAMMIRAILIAQKSGCSYAYLGSVRSDKDLYKLQFEGLEWFDGAAWQTSLEELKRTVRQTI